MGKLLLSLFFVLAVLCASAQSKDSASAASAPPPAKDTVQKKKLSFKERYAYPSPTVAMVSSAIIPGLGQAYNKKYWKIPIVYAALGTLGYLAYIANHNYQEYHKELLLRYKYEDSASLYSLHNPDPKLSAYSTTDLNTQKLIYQKHFDMAIVGMGLV